MYHYIFNPLISYNLHINYKDMFKLENRIIQKIIQRDKNIQNCIISRMDLNKNKNFPIN